MLTSDVQSLITSRCAQTTPFDSESFDAIEYLNSKFNSSTKVSDVVQHLAEVDTQVALTEQEFCSAVEQQSTYSEGASSHQNSLETVRNEITALSRNVSGLQSRAQNSEEVVNEISSHIRRLDLAKKNISSAIYTLQCMQRWMLQLQTVASAFDKQTYALCRDALKEAKSYQSQLSHFGHLPPIVALNEQHRQVCKQLESKTYYLVFPKRDPSVFDDINETVLTDVCGIISLLDVSCRKRVCDHIVELLMRPYKARFKRGTEDAKLERTERRYAFLRTILERYHSLLFSVVPPHWCVPQELCVSFCLQTKEDLDYQLQEAKGRVEIAVLTFVLQKTIDIEKDLTLMMEWKDDFPGRSEVPHYKYNGIIVSAFKQHMIIFIRNEEKLMDEVMAASVTGGDALPGWNGEANTSNIRAGITIPLANDIFFFIKESLKRTLRLSQPEVLVEMIAVWRRRLLTFAQNCGSFFPATAVSLKELRRAGYVANTAWMCRSTTEDLVEELRSRSGLTTNDLDFQRVSSAFMSLYSAAIQSLLKGLLQTLSPVFTAYASDGEPTSSATAPSANTTNSSKSPLRRIISILHQGFLTCSAMLALQPLRFLLENMVEKIIPMYRRALMSKPLIRTEEVSLLREDTLSLKRVFSELPNFNDPDRFAAASLAIHVKFVTSSFQGILCMLKVLEADSTDMEKFSDFYYATIPVNERSITHFVRIIEQKGVNREHARQWITALSKRGVVQETALDKEVIVAKVVKGGERKS